MTVWDQEDPDVPMFLLILYAGIKLRCFYVNITERGPFNSLHWLDLTQSMGCRS